MAATNKVTKADLISIISDSLNISKIQTEKNLNTTLTTIVRLICEGKQVSLTGFGSFYYTDRKSRSGINPKNKSRMTIPGYRAAGFKVGKHFKDLVKTSVDGEVSTKKSKIKI